MKKILCLSLSVILMLASLNTYVVGAYNESLVIDELFEGSCIIDVKNKQTDLSGTSDKKYFLQDSTYAFNHYSYEMLDTAQRIIYDAVVNNPGKLSIEINFDNGVFSYSNWTDQYFKNLMNAICNDRPDIFYYAGYSIPGGYLYSGGQYVSQITYNIQPFDSTIYTESNLTGYYNALMAVLPTIPVETSNRYNFIKSVHDYLCNNIYYPDLSSTDYVMSAHDAYGALIEGRAVCQGYSDAIKIICDYYGIPCVCIPGTSDGYGHMWNAVQMDDGVWYLIDATWNDQESRTYYDFFLVGTESTNTYFGGLKFSEEHVNDEDSFLPLLNYSASGYNITQNHNTEFKATYNSYADPDENILYLSAFDIGKSNVYYHGMPVGVSAFENDIEFYAPSGASGASESWSMVLLGDVNSDDVCDSLDYSAAVNMMISEDTVADTTAERACDINVDGYIDVLDISLIARAVSGLNTNFELD